MNKVTIAMCQMLNTVEKKDNIKKAKKMIEATSCKGADIVILPEIFNCPYHYSYFRANAEKFPEGETLKMLSKAAKDNNIYLFGGSIPELDEENNVYNTCFIFNKSGELIGKHRKMHLFDVDIENGVKFQESKTFKSGSSINVVETEYGKIGVGICYDVRFPELIRSMTIKGAEIIILPAAFNMTTGPAHWETLFKCRALDNQVYMIGCSPARNSESSYVAYGNSIVTNPWGEIIYKMDEKEGIMICELDLDYVNKIRKELPLLKHRRTDIY